MLRLGGGNMTKRYKILIVDDEEGKCEGLQALLEHAGYKVFAAYNSRDALKLARDESPDLVLMDFILDEKKNGVEVFEDIQKADPNAKAILYTGCCFVGHGKQVMKAYRGGEILEFMHAPNRPSDWLEAVKRHLN